MTILAIDPGPEQSGWVVLSAGGRVLCHGVWDNHDLLAALSAGFDEVVIEKVASYGMAVGESVFETVYWTGRFDEATGGVAVRIPRRDVKLHLCGDSRAKDANIRQALIDMYGGGMAKGTKSSPGPLYGIKSHEWSALALGVTHLGLEPGFLTRQ